MTLKLVISENFRIRKLAEAKNLSGRCVSLTTNGPFRNPDSKSANGSHFSGRGWRDGITE